MATLALLCTLIGSTGFYCAAPRQRLVPPIARPGALRTVSLALLAGGGLAWCIALHPAAGCFATLTVMMCAWIGLPYAAAWREARRAGGRMARTESRVAWLSKSVAGAVLGFGLAIAFSGLFAWLGPGGLAPVNKYQFSMWIVAPLWLGVLSAVFLFSSAARAWLVLGGANVLAFAVLWLVRQGAG